MEEHNYIIEKIFNNLLLMFYPGQHFHLQVYSVIQNIQTQYKLCATYRLKYFSIHGITKKEFISFLQRKEKSNIILIYSHYLPLLMQTVTWKLKQKNNWTGLDDFLHLSYTFSKQNTIISSHKLQTISLGMNIIEHRPL